jgi:hypothetical protein
MRSLANFAGFQAAWWASVLGAAQGAAWVGIVACAAFVVLQWCLSPRRSADARGVACALAAGLLLDGLLAQTGWIYYSAAVPGLPAPAWILALWAAFAMTLGHSLAWLRPGSAALFGALGGPLAYLGAERLGAVDLAMPVAAVVALAIGWALASWWLVWVSTRARARHAVPTPSLPGGAR